MDKIRVSAAIYVNGDTGYYLHPRDTYTVHCANLHHLVLESEYVCEYCDREVAEEDVMRVNSITLCYECYDENYFRCGYGEHHVSIEECVQLDKYGPICEDCARAATLDECAQCGVYHEQEYLMAVDHDEVYCDSCAEELDAYPCYDCGTLLTVANYEPLVLEDNTDLWVCEYCEQGILPSRGGLTVCHAQACADLATTGELCTYHRRNLHTDNFLALGEYK
jgi:hypothetical protein